MNRNPRLARLLPTVLLSAFLFGCQSPLPPLGQPRVFEPGEILTPAEHRRASALAHYAHGMLHEINDNYDLALEHYRAAVLADPESEELYFREAMAHFQRGEPERSIEVLVRLVDQLPASARAYRWLALIYRAAEYPEKSAETYDQWIRKFPDDPVPYVQKSDLYLKNEQVDEAEALLLKAEKKLGDKVPILKALADVYLSQGITGEKSPEKAALRGKAIEVLERVAEQDDTDRLVMNRLAELYILDRQLDKAIQCYETLEGQNPGDRRLRERMVQGYLSTGEEEKAIEVLEKMADEDAGDPKPQLAIAEIYLQLEDLEKATQAYMEAIAADPLSPSAYLQAALLNMEPNPELSLEVVQDGLEKMPGEITLTEMMAYVYMVGLTDYASAVPYFEKVIEKVGKRVFTLEPSFFFNYTFALQRSGNTEKATDQLEKLYQQNADFLEVYMRGVVMDPDALHTEAAGEVLALLRERYPDEPRIPYYLGTLQNYLGQYEEALQYFEACRAKVKETGEAEEILGRLFYFWYGAALERTGKFDEAVEKLETAIEIDPEFADAYNYLAYMWAEKDIELERALEYIQKALELEPESGAFIDTLGWIHYRQGDFEKAHAETEKALKVLPDDPTILEHMGDILLALDGNAVRAGRYWARSLEANPENESLQDKLEEHQLDAEELLKEPDGEVSVTEEEE